MEDDSDTEEFSETDVMYPVDESLSSDYLPDSRSVLLKFSSKWSHFLRILKRNPLLVRRNEVLNLSNSPSTIGRTGSVLKRSIHYSDYCFLLYPTSQVNSMVSFNPLKEFRVIYLLTLTPFCSNPPHSFPNHLNS